MADLLVILISMTLMVQVAIFGIFLLFGATARETDLDASQPSPYQPMDILLARAARKRAAAAAAVEKRAA